MCSAIPQERTEIVLNHIGSMLASMKLETQIFRWFKKKKKSSVKSLGLPLSCKLKLLLITPKMESIWFILHFYNYVRFAIPSLFGRHRGAFGFSAFNSKDNFTTGFFLIAPTSGP